MPSTVEAVDQDDYDNDEEGDVSSVEPVGESNGMDVDIDMIQCAGCEQEMMPTEDEKYCVRCAKVRGLCSLAYS